MDNTNTSSDGSTWSTTSSLGSDVIATWNQNTTYAPHLMVGGNSYYTSLYDRAKVVPSYQGKRYDLNWKKMDDRRKYELVKEIVAFCGTPLNQWVTEITIVTSCPYIDKLISKLSKNGILEEVISELK